MSKEYIIDETEWWDRVAIAVEMLQKKPGVQRRAVVAQGQPVELIGNVEAAGTEAPAGTPAVTAYLFHHIEDVEILRRLNQMPDETPLDMLVQPFSIYCPDMKSLVSINDPSISLEEHIRKMRKTNP